MQRPWGRIVLFKEKQRGCRARGEFATGLEVGYKRKESGWFQGLGLEQLNDTGATGTTVGGTCLAVGKRELSSSALDSMSPPQVHPDTPAYGSPMPTSLGSLLIFSGPTPSSVP